MSNTENRKVYIIGGGVAGMAAAAFLISDGGMKGNDILILERETEGGGSFDGRGSARDGYLCSGYRMFEEYIYLSTYDLLSKIPSQNDPQKSLKDDFFAFNKKIKVRAKARLVENGKIIDISRFGLCWKDRFKLTVLLFMPESFFGKKEIKDYFTPGFFKTNFWFEWSTTFAFQTWHSLVEMKRYLGRFVHDAPLYYDMSCVLSAPYCEHDFIIVPVQKWLEENGVHFEHDCKVDDLDFEVFENKKAVTGISLKNSGGGKKIKIRREDLVFITNGSITADASRGSMDKAPLPVMKESGSWDLWNSIAKKCDGFGNPSVFCGSSKKSCWESFTITFHNPLFIKMVEKFTGNKAGTGGLTTFTDSNWLITLTIPFQPYFINQPDDAFVCWGYGMFPEKQGNFVKKKMSDCSGCEILEELCGHLGFTREAEAIIESSICIPCVMPYITSQFLPRVKADRPEVVPAGSHNFALIGQYVEIPNEIVFTVECSIRSAKSAVKKLLNLPIEIPPIHQGKYSVRNVFNAIRVILK